LDAKLFKGLEAFDRQPPEKSVVQKVADSYEMLGLLEEKERVLEKYNHIFVEAGKGQNKKLRNASSKKNKKSGKAFLSHFLYECHFLMATKLCAVNMFND
jgi:hypothetical protein